MTRILLLSLIILLVFCLIGGLNFGLREGRFEFEEEGRAGERASSSLRVRSNSRIRWGARLHSYLKTLIALTKYTGDRGLQNVAEAFSSAKRGFLVTKLKIGPPHSYLFQKTPFSPLLYCLFL